MWNLKKGHDECLCRTDTDSQTLKNGFQRRQFGGQGDALGVWDENPITLDCDDHCTIINVINSLNKKIKYLNCFSKKKKKFLALFKCVQAGIYPDTLHC